MSRPSAEPLADGPKREGLLHRDVGGAVELPGEHRVELHLTDHVVEQGVPRLRALVLEARREEAGVGAPSRDA
eukprot:6930027-Lingulodinium_polyedra.AAC.1